jgi:hypothetical protein
MGDRAVIGFKAKRESAPLWLYGHWNGYRRYGDLGLALAAAEPRWTDESYANRIAVSTIVGEDWKGELNWGLTTDIAIIEAAEYEDVPVVIWDERVIDITLRGGDPVATMDFSTFLEELELNGDGDLVEGGIKFAELTRGLQL